MFIEIIILFFLILSILWIVGKNPVTKNFLITALILRVLFAIIDEYFFILPSSKMDAWTYEYLAYNYSQEYGLNIFSILFNGDSYFLSKLISIFYTLFERSSLMANMLSVVFGTLAVFLVYRLTFNLWGERAALKAGWFITLFPTSILFSSIVMREIYIVFFLTYALIHCIDFLKKKRLINFLKLSVGFIFAALFHGPIFIGYLLFLSYTFIKILIENNFFIHFKKSKIYSLLVLPLLLMPLITYLLGYYSIPKLGKVDNFVFFKEDITNINAEYKFGDIIIWKIKRATASTNNNELGAQFPSWTKPNNILELIYLSPIRLIYFIYSPFPWDIKRLNHLIGALDAFFYIYLTFCIIKNYKKLSRNPYLVFLAIILLGYLLIYSYGVGNFGTGIRHRFKFIIILLAIAAPSIHKFSIKNFNKS